MNVHRSIVDMLCDAAKPSDQRRKLLVFKVYRRFRFLHQKLAEGADGDFNAFRSSRNHHIKIIGKRLSAFLCVLAQVDFMGDMLGQVLLITRLQPVLLFALY